MTATPETTQVDHPHLLLAGLAQQGKYAFEYARAGQTANALEHLDAIDRLTAAYRATLPDEQPIGSPSPVHKHFGLSYANYLVVPRTFLQSMPHRWQAPFVALLEVMQQAFAHVPQADVYDVTAGKEDLLRDMTESELFQAGVEVTGDDELGHGPDTKYHRISDGEELDGDSYGFRPGKDPVPHYNRGRTRIKPRLGGGE